jgi:hypothetical protein
MTSRPSNNRSAQDETADSHKAGPKAGSKTGPKADLNRPDSIEDPGPTPDEVPSIPESNPATTSIPGMLPIIDVRATSVEGNAPGKDGSTNPRPKTDRGQDMFPDVAEVPPEYSGLFQDYDNAGVLGVDAPLWLDGPETDANSGSKLPTLMIGGVVLTALASGMGLAQLHNMRQASAPDLKSPKDKTPQARPGDRTNSIATRQAGSSSGTKAASLASPERLRPNWLTPGAKATSNPKATGSLASSPIALGKAPIAPGPIAPGQIPPSQLSSSSAIPPLVLPTPKPKPLTILTPSVTTMLSARPMLSAAALSSPRIFPARLTYPVVRPARIADRPGVRPVARPAVRPAVQSVPRSPLASPPVLQPAPDRFSSLTTANAPGREPQLRSIDEVMADRTSQAPSPNARKSQQARSVDTQGNEFGYESLRALRSVPQEPLSPGTETAQWDATNRVITGTAAAAATVANPGMAAISMPALSISVQESLLSEPSLPKSKSTEGLAPAAEVWSAPVSQPTAPKASVPDPETAPQAMAPRSLELAAIPSGFDRTISSPEYSSPEYSSPEYSSPEYSSPE